NLGRGIQLGDVHTTQKVEDSHVTLTPVNPDGQQQFVTSMLNLTPDVGMESIFETTSQMDRMNEAVKVAVQIQSDHLRDEAQKENDEFLKTIDENMQKIIKEQVKEQVKTSARESDAVEEPMQTTFKMEEPSHPEFKTGADDQPIVQSSQYPEWFSQQKKPPTPNRNKSIQRSDEQWNLYKALVEAYDADKTILESYGESVILKRRRKDDDQEGPSAGLDRGSKRQRE
nr:hypothetical protein [Tanacetum cinerariifolium]